PQRESWIRLAELLPSKTEAEPIRCSLRETLLSQPVRYEALSYCWGDLGSDSTIECNGKALGIRRNLEEALRHLRHRDKPRLLWIDAICINQDDRAEKADQVPLMRNIYSRAERTLVWLGQPGDKYDR
ncbi:hypothetical protein GQ53DRAFT_611188, partial [Thozetella sp. PMI_491]